MIAVAFYPILSHLQQYYDYMNTNYRGIMGVRRDDGVME